MPEGEDVIGAIKVKDGLFIGDEFSAQVSRVTAGFGVRSREQGDEGDQLRGFRGPQPLGADRSAVPELQLAR